tara:strand:+ start:40355 stop:41590 length:1236 start_codon:yes stop_codon:yes gene_type:complete
LANNKYDLIVFGATSFVGMILTKHLLSRTNISANFKWALAGRSQHKLEQLQVSLGAAAKTLQLVIADSNDIVSLRNLCHSTRLIVSTVGPYALYGENLVAICAETGTDYCDITGEVHWIRRMIDKYQVLAQSSGARIVNSCGFDSIPSDIGNYFLQAKAQEKFKCYLPLVSMRVAKITGGISGGTIASFISTIEALKASPALNREIANPRYLCPENGPKKNSGRNPKKKQRYDTNFDSWIAPFIMENINSRIVMRSSYLGDMSYGDNFTYDEAILTGKGILGLLKSLSISFILTVLIWCFYFRTTRAILNLFFLPAPGEGPSVKSQQRGSFMIQMLGRNHENYQLRVCIKGDSDPGYGSTAKMLGQCALCLLETSKTKVPGGFLTPASAMGSMLLSRLQKNAGLTFEIDEH